MKIIRALMLLLIITSCGNHKENTTAFVRNKIRFTLSSCEENYIRIHASLKNAVSYDDQFIIQLKDKQNFIKQNNGSWVYGDYSVTPIKNGYTLSVNNEKVYTATFEIFNNKEIEEYRTYENIEFFRGLGQSSKTTNLKGGRFTINHTPHYGDQTYLYIPMYIADSNYLNYYNAKGYDGFQFPRSSDDEVKYIARSGIVDAYFKKVDTFREAVQSFSTITESHSLLPEWAFGFIQSKYGYKTDKEVLELVERFKKENIPLSAIILDLYWFNKMGDLDWNREAFKEPEQMAATLHKNGIKLITITEPFFTNNSLLYEEFSNKNFFAVDKNNKIVTWSDWWCFGATNGSVINPLAPNLQERIGEIYNKMINSGIDGFWTDLGEPERVPGTALFNGIPEKYFHNYFNREWSRIIYDGVTTLNPDKRLFILSRSGYTGSTKYNVSIWTGDVGATFSALREQIPLGINASSSGFSYWGTDVGGFVPAVSSPELMLRWYQFSTFTPIFRAHGTGPREPWEAKEHLPILKKYINERYRILPYIYSLARETDRDHLPMMRGMFMDYPETPERYHDTQFMFGDYLLVSPVTQEIAFAREQKIYLPKGKWYDYESMMPIEGDQEIEVQNNLSSIPVYMKEGTIMPIVHSTKNAFLLIPSTKTSSFIYYADDGETNNYKKGEYQEIKITLSNSKLELEGKNPIGAFTLLLLKSATSSMPPNWKDDGKFYSLTINESSTKAMYSL